MIIFFFFIQDLLVPPHFLPHQVFVLSHIQKWINKNQQRIGQIAYVIEHGEIHWVSSKLEASSYWLAFKVHKVLYTSYYKRKVIINLTQPWTIWSKAVATYKIPWYSSDINAKVIINYFLISSKSCYMKWTPHLTLLIWSRICDYVDHGP